MRLRRYFCLFIVSPGRIETGRLTKQLTDKTLVSFRLFQRLEGRKASPITHCQNTGSLFFLLQFGFKGQK